MATVEQNLERWDHSYTWTDGGEYWSQVWGGSEAQWFFVIYPRIHRFLPARRLLEIAPGHGRWTQYLRTHCRHLIGVDLSSSCADACRRRFGSDADVAFYVNDGYSLSMVPDRSVDFAFTFDSLVHAERDVVASYLGELVKKLAPGGAAFLHHSNLGAYRDTRTGELPSHIRNPCWRALSMSAAAFTEDCEAVGLKCASQEVVNWGVEHLSDCFSVVTADDSTSGPDTVVVENPDFMKEAHRVAKVSRPYVRSPHAKPAP